MRIAANGLRRQEIAESIDRMRCVTENFDGLALHCAKHANRCEDDGCGAGGHSYWSFVPLMGVQRSSCRCSLRVGQLSSEAESG